MIISHILRTKKVIRFFQRITFFYAVFLLSTTNSNAQTYHFDYYGVKEGLSQSKVFAVIQDNQGYLWLGTEGGVSKFDGVHFVNYTTENGLADGGVKALFVDSKGNVWMGHQSGGVSFFDGEGFKIHPVTDSLSSDVTSFVLDNKSALWVTTYGDGLVRLDNPYEFDPEKIEYQQYKGGSLSDIVISGCTAKGDSLFFITGTGIRKYNAEDNSFERYSPEGLSTYFAITSMLEDKKGDIWIGSYHGGLYRYIKETNEFKIYDIRDGLASNWVSTIIEDSQGNIWLGTWGGGVSKFDGERFKTFNNSNGLEDLKIWKIAEDFEGNILVATHEHGIAIFKGERFVTYGEEDGLINQQVWAVSQDKGGKYWIGTNKGVSVFNSTSGRNGIKFAHYDMKTNNIGDQIRYLKRDINDNMWIGTNDNGVSMFNYKSGRFEYNPVINRYVSNNIVTAMDVDNNNQLWVGTMAGLIYYDIKEDQSTRLSQVDGLNGKDISAIYVDSKDRVWVGINNKGLNIIEGTTFKKVEFDGMVTPKCMVEDKDGNVLIGTLTKGILVCDGEKIIKTITESDGLLSNLIAQLNIDDKNNIFVGTSRGLNKIDVKGKIHVYTEKSGFTGIEAKDNATFKDKDGNLWFGTVNGVVKYQPKMDYCADPEPLTHIDKMLINRKNREMISNQSLNYLENDITFEYNSICLNNPDAVQYQIMLEPADKEWRPVTTQTVATYSSLAPGKYAFKVKAKNSAGVWNSNPVMYEFNIKPPFYKTWWFILSAIALGIIGIVSYIKVREKNLIKEKKILEDKVEERTAEVVQKSIELEKKNKDITDSIRYAKRIQTAVLPPEIPFDDTFIFFRPKDIVSGDFYWIETIGNKEMIAAVDCTGHGVPGAFLSILGHSMLTKIVREYGILEPAKILDQLDLEIINALHQKNVKGERVVNDGMDLALICYNKDTQILEYSGGYNPLIRIRAGELEEIKADRFPIGMTTVHDNKKFTNHEIKVEKGDAYYIFSDGYADQFGGEDGRKLRKKNLKDILIAIQNKTMEEQGTYLEEYILEWMKNHDQIDDIVFVGRRF